MIATKLFVPTPRRNALARPRLVERLRRGSEARLILVCAPAGFGKTTLLTQWLGRSPADPRTAAWLSLDAADRDPATFWTHVVAALRTVLPGVGPGAPEQLASSSSQVPVVLADLVNDLAADMADDLSGDLAAAPEDVWLVLDDYHLVDSRELRDDMTFLLDHLPPQLHVVLGTWADPDLPLSRWRARGELVEVRAADLRFTPEEAADYLGGAAGSALTPGDVAALTQRTEGWIAALQLAALSIRDREDVAGFVARFAGDDRYVMDYLVEEVLDRQPDEVRAFLLQTAVLDRLTGALCDAVTGRGDGSAVLVALERANLFLVPLDDRRAWYRYHHLFADVLRARLLAEQPAQLPALHLRASRWYGEHDLIEEAVGHALAGRDTDRAADLMVLAVPGIRRTRQDALFAGWLRALPDATVRASPVLSVFRGGLLLGSGDPDAVEERFTDAERLLAAGPAGSPPPWADTEEVRVLPATVAVYRAALAQARGDLAGVASHARDASRLARPDDHLARAGAAGYLALAAWCAGDVSSAASTFEQVVRGLHAAGSTVDESSATLVLARMWVAAGRPAAARRLYTEALAVVESADSPTGGRGGAADGRGGSSRGSRAAGDLHVGLAEIDLDGGDLDGARAQLDAAASLDESSALPDRHRRFMAMSRVAAHDGDTRGAIDLLDRAQQHAVAGFLPEIRPIPAMRARLLIADGRLSEAADWAREEGVSATEAVGFLREFDHLTLVRLLLARHRAAGDTGALEEARGLLDRLQDAARAAGRADSLLDIELLQERAGHAPLTPPRAVSGPIALSGRELQVLRLLDSELTGPEIARQLFVSHNTVRTHTQHIFTKLDVTSRRAAVRRARERGLT